MKIALDSIYDKQTRRPDDEVVVFDGPLKEPLYTVLNEFQKGREDVIKYYPQEVIKGLLTKDVTSGIYHMGDDEALSTNELIEVICSALGKKAHIWNIPRGLMNGVAKMGDVLHLPLNTQRMQKLTENYVVSNAKIKAALGMKEMPVRAKDGLRETIKSFAEK